MRMSAAAAALLLGAPSAFAADAPTPLQGAPTQRSLLALDTSRLDNTALVMVAGYARPGDGGGGLFLWQPQSTESTDGVFVLVPDNGGQTGRWIRQGQADRVAPEIAGASGNGTSDDQPAFSRLIAASRKRGAFTIALTPGRHYYAATTLDLSVGAPGLAMAGPASPRVALHSGAGSVPDTRLELNAAEGASVKLGAGQVLQDVLVWRHGLAYAPTSLADVRSEVQNCLKKMAPTGN